MNEAERGGRQHLPWQAEVRRLLGRLKRRAERELHPVRRREAERLAERATGPILVLCRGNICRSPYAAAVLSGQLRDRGVAVTSAGVIGPGRAAPRMAQQVAAARGIDLSAHRSRLLTREQAEGAALVVVMSRAQRAGFQARYGKLRPVLILGDLDPEAIDARAIADPLNRDYACFSRVYARIDRCTGRLAELLGSRTRPVAPSLVAR